MLGRGSSSVDDLNRPPEPITMTRVLSADHLYQWRSELDQFVIRARHQLESLDQLLAPCETGSRSLPDATNGNSEGTSPLALEASLVRPSCLSTIEATVEDQMHPIVGSVPVAGDIDPTDRLNAIKLRLAEQIQST